MGKLIRAAVLVLPLLTAGPLSAQNDGWVGAPCVDFNRFTRSCASLPYWFQPGTTHSVQLTVHNTGTTTWTAADGYQLGVVNPSDNAAWSPTRFDLPSPVPPGSGLTMSFSFSVPSTVGTYNLQWRMVQNGAGFGTAGTNYVATISPTRCQWLPNPNDMVADDSGILCLIDQAAGSPSKTLRLAPSTPSWSNGYLIAEGIGLTDPNRYANLTIRSADLRTLSGVSCPGAIANIPSRPILKADPSLGAAAPSPVEGLLHFYHAQGVTIRDLIFDADGRNRTNTAVLCHPPEGVNFNTGSLILEDVGAGTRVENNKFLNALCGAALYLAGDNYRVQYNTITDSGTDERNGSYYADGIRADRCTNSTISCNLINNFTDVGIALGDTASCMIQNNTLRTSSTIGWAGTGFPGGHHPGSVIRDNLIQGNGLLHIGLSIGASSWGRIGDDLKCGKYSDGGTVSFNSVSGVFLGLEVENSAHVVSGNTLSVSAVLGSPKDCATSRGVTSPLQCAVLDATGVSQSECTNILSFCDCIP